MSRSTVEPIVRIAEGLLRGRVQQSVRDGSSYYSFQGIPYAQPPVGPLRFKPPKPVEAWQGTRDALKEGPTAPSFSMMTGLYVEDSCEDCLYLNVYTPEIPDNAAGKRPVLFWIHGGGFGTGSGNTDLYGPDYLISKGVVLVTINYRLGALGFLSLQSTLCPGNNGLRDQAEALRWVQRNISVFGGDPGNVTIFGESAGGAAVQYQMLSPQTKGLFHRAISQSGFVLSGWAHSRRPVECARALGEVCGLKTTNDAELLDFLRTVPARDIVVKSKEVAAIAEPEPYYLRNKFLPVAEPEHADAFISRPLEQLISEGQLHDVPYIVGVNTLEGLIMVNPLLGLVPLHTKDELARLLPPHRKLEKGTPKADAIVEKIRRFYFSLGFDDRKFADALSSIYFLAAINEVLRGLGNAKSRNSKTYFYSFTQDPKTSVFKSAWGFQDWKGTFHGDELLSLFYMNSAPSEVVPGSEKDRMIDLLTSLWTDFAKTGNPTPTTNSWPPYNNIEKQYLDISIEPRASKDFNADEMQFWQSIFEEINS